MHGDQPAGHAEPRVPEKSNQPANADHRKTGLDDPRAVDILTTEHWSLISSRTLGYQEMFGRATIFIGIVSATVVALACWLRPPISIARRCRSPCCSLPSPCSSAS